MVQCPIVELRQYTLHPGRSGDLIALFDREFIEPQEELGMTVIGQFRDIDDPDRFVWLRGFADMRSRLESLSTFYSGPTWQAHRQAANATIVDSDNVLLLRPTREAAEFELKARDGMRADLIANVCYFEDPVETDFVPHFEETVVPLIERIGGSVAAYFVTEHSRNDYPKLPVREDENAFVWFAALRDHRGYDEHVRAVQAFASSSAGRLRRDIEVRRLTPTSMSRLG